MLLGFAGSTVVDLNGLIDNWLSLLKRCLSLFFVIKQTQFIFDVTDGTIKLCVKLDCCCVLFPPVPRTFKQQYLCLCCFIRHTVENTICTTVLQIQHWLIWEYLSSLHLLSSCGLLDKYIYKLYVGFHFYWTNNQSINGGRYHYIIIIKLLYRSQVKPSKFF